MNAQLDKLDTLIAAAQRARIAAEHGLLFADRRGAALLNAVYDLTEIDAVYDMARDVELDCSGTATGIDPSDPHERSELICKAITRRAA